MIKKFYNLSNASKDVMVLKADLVEAKYVKNLVLIQQAEKLGDI